MQTLTAKDAKYGFGRLIDLARAGPVGVAKHGRPVVVVMAPGVRSVNGVGYAEARAGGKSGGKGGTMPRGGPQKNAARVAAALPMLSLKNAHHDAQHSSSRMSASTKFKSEICT